MATTTSDNETAQNCYAMAYFLLPQYVFGQTERLVSSLSGNPTLGAAFYYFMACRMNGKEPRDELIRSFSVHAGSLDEGHDYWVVGYPTPPAVDLSDVPREEMLEVLQSVVLAPYFSAVIQNRQSKEVRYFILGQSVDGFTTLRGVSMGGEGYMNDNLGPGCEPELEHFLGLLRERLALGRT